MRYELARDKFFRPVLKQWLEVSDIGVGPGQFDPSNLHRFRWLPHNNLYFRRISLDNWSFSKMSEARKLLSVADMHKGSDHLEAQRYYMPRKDVFSTDTFAYKKLSNGFQLKIRNYKDPEPHIRIVISGFAFSSMQKMVSINDELRAEATFIYGSMNVNSSWVLAHPGTPPENAFDFKLLHQPSNYMNPMDPFLQCSQFILHKALGNEHSGVYRETISVLQYLFGCRSMANVEVDHLHQEIGSEK